MYKFKAKGFGFAAAPSCLGNISKDWKSEKNWI